MAPDEAKPPPRALRRRGGGFLAFRDRRNTGSAAAGRIVKPSITCHIAGEKPVQLGMSKTWERYGTPCANSRYTVHLGVQVDPWRLDECAECEFCGSCVTHMCYRDDASTLLHLDHFKDFASPGEAECGDIGGPGHLVPSVYQPRPCNRVVGHDGKHRARMGWSWPLKARRTA